MILIVASGGVILERDNHGDLKMWIKWIIHRVLELRGTVSITYVHFALYPQKSFYSGLEKYI